MTQKTATGIGFVAVLFWSQLAVLTALSGAVPPFQLVAMSFVTATAIGAVWCVMSGRGLASALDAPPAAWVLGLAGLCGYHFFYFLALRSAPAVEANLINYLWPLLIVLFSALLPARDGGAGLRWWHLAGALLGLAGTAAVVTGGSLASPGQAPWTGYAAALAAALLWSSYSVLSRRFARVPSTCVTGFCAITAIVALLAHLALEDTVWPGDALQWAAVAGLGLGPVGGAFYVWDYGVKHGDIRVLGAAAYLAPMLSTLSLVLFGLGKAGPALWVACALITAGAMLAAKDMLFAGRD